MKEHTCGFIDFVGLNKRRRGINKLHFGGGEGGGGGLGAFLMTYNLPREIQTVCSFPNLRVERGRRESDMSEVKFVFFVPADKLK